MARTALQLSATQLAAYRPGRIEPHPGIEDRLARAREAANVAAALLRDRFGATRVVVFGSLVHPDSFTPWSDIDLAASGIPADEFFRAVGALSGLSAEFKIDLVDPDGCRLALRQEIDREGEELWTNAWYASPKGSQDLAELDLVVERAAHAWQRACEIGDDHYLDSVALNLHGFYSRLERILELVASGVDGKLPRGENWHRLLLEPMAAEAPGLRPAVVSSLTVERLEEFRGFRHVVRNVYTFRFDPDRMEKLVERLPEAFSSASAELQAFAQFLLAAGT